MKKTLAVLCFISIAGALMVTASAQQEVGKKGGKKDGGAKKMELPHPFYWAAPDSYRGDWQGAGYVAQVFPIHDRELSVADLIPQPSDNGLYQANVFRAFDVENNKPVAILKGELLGEEISFTGDGWTGTISGGHFKAANGGEPIDMQHINRVPPTLGQKPPAGAVVLFDGTNMDAWAKMKEKDWLTEDGPSQWHLVPGGAMEVVPRSGSLISHKWFGDAKIHVEFRNLGGPTNSGVYVQDRYESNINEVYGRLDGNPCAGFDNSTPPEAKVNIRASRPVLEWQTLDIDFRAPRFDASGRKTQDPRVTLLFNGTVMYKDRALGPVTLNAARLGEAPTGPIQLQEHGMPAQFRNVWVVEGKK
jgi:hypothetical protein